MPWVFSHLRGLDSWDKQPPPSPPPPPPPVRGKVREGSGRFGKVAREGYHPYHLCQGYHPYHLCQGWCSTRSLVRGRPVRGCRELGPAELPLRRDLPFRQIQREAGNDDVVALPGRFGARAVPDAGLYARRRGAGNERAVPPTGWRGGRVPQGDGNRGAALQTMR